VIGNHFGWNHYLVEGGSWLSGIRSFCSRSGNSRTDDLKTKEDKFYDTFDNYTKEFRNFAVPAIEFYTDALAAGDWLKDKGIKIIDTVKEMYNSLPGSWAERALGAVDPRMRTVNKKEETKNILNEKIAEENKKQEIELAKKQNALQEENNKTLRALLNVNTEKTTTDPNIYMNQVLYQIGRTMTRNRDFEEKTLKQTEKLVELTRRMVESGISRFGGV
jgi:hypothetical protein